MASLLRRLTVVLVMLTAAFWPWPAAARNDQPVFSTVDGRTFAIDELRGKVVLVDFWATWCAPCLAEMPRLKALHRGYSRNDLVIIGVSLDMTDRRTLTSWLRRHGINWPQVHDARGYNGALARRFGIDKLPATVVFDREGRIVRRDLRGAPLANALQTLVAVTATPPDTQRSR